MTPPSAWLLSRIDYQFAAVQAMTEWWHWLLLLAVCGVIVAYIIFVYIRDMVELPVGLGLVLLLLRLLAFAGILLVFLGLQRFIRSEKQIVKNSRVLLLVDTSQSMGLADADSTTAALSPPAAKASRIKQVVRELAHGSLLRDLRTKHDVVVLHFDRQEKPIEIASFSKVRPAEDPQRRKEEAAARRAAALFQSRVILAIAGGFLLAAVLAGATHLVIRYLFAAGTSWALLLGVLALIVAVVTAAVANLLHPEVGFRAVVGLAQPAAQEESAGRSADGESAGKQPADEPEEEVAVDWEKELLPRGAETRIGDALLYLVNKERGKPVAGFVLVSDGRSNAGVAYQEAIEVAREAHIPVYTVGLGSEKRPANVRVVDIEAPERAYPGDSFPISGVVQAYGMAGRSVTVELVSAPDGDTEAAETFEDEVRIDLGAEGRMVPVPAFQVSEEEAGTRVWRLRVRPPAEDHDPTDNEKSATVRVVRRKNRVLLFAGGPTREYRFLRNQLFRDKETTVDVLLQTARPGMSQEADDILNEFPSDEDELFGTGDQWAEGPERGYDCIVAFDPDWRELDESQVQLLERWVAEKGGGLVVIAGPVNTPEWASMRRGDPRIDTIKALYPVVFYSRGTSLGLERFGSETPSALHFTREGRAAKFLFLDDDPVRSEEAWAGFEGVYGYYTIKSVKAGATIYARFADERVVDEEDYPVYFAGHYYGAGRVFFAASGEMWRLRGLDETYFEQYYTRLIRHVSEGRLLRDSSRGVLLVGKDRVLLGDTVAVRAQLTDSQHRGLTAAKVEAVLVHPDGNRIPLVMKKVKAAVREGSYAAQFVALQEGDYRLELAVPESTDEVLTREVHVRLPDREIEQPQRDDKTLKEIAKRTGARYYVGMPTVMGRAQLPPLSATLTAQDRVISMPDSRDQRDDDFQQRLRGWLMAVICGALFLEWTLRRLNKLA